MLDELVLWLVENWNEVTMGILLIVILYGGSRRDPWWVFGWLFKERTLERDEWKKSALKGTVLARRSVTVAEKVVDDDE